MASLPRTNENTTYFQEQHKGHTKCHVSTITALQEWVEDKDFKASLSYIASSGQPEVQETLTQKFQNKGLKRRISN